MKLHGGGAASAPLARGPPDGFRVQWHPQPLPKCSVCRKAAGYSNSRPLPGAGFDPIQWLIEPMAEH